MNSRPTHQREMTESWPPLWSIGLAVTFMLLVPIVLYSMAPSGPIREGDTVFATGRHTVGLVDLGRYEQAGYEQSCVIEHRDPLIIIRRPSDRPGSPLIAEVQGKTRIEFPFCPPNAKVLLRTHQVNPKPALLDDIKDRVGRIFAP
ncbi:MAG TPA: hypothetical protein VJ692_09325 [Nitrospiraceae bacterium]|nr:hypothetical protein [Nitrospiraceae bacterium]